MTDSKNLFLGQVLVMAIVLVFGCHHISSLDGDSGPDTDTDSDGDSDTGPIECNLGEYSGDFTIDTQSLVATLAGYTSISGNLFIQGASCTDLSELICLTSVGGDLNFEDSITLTNLNGLDNIISVDGSLIIFDTEALTNLDGLNALTSVGEDLVIDINTALTNVDGLSALISVGGDLSIFENYDLPDCEVCDLLGQLTSGPTLTDVHDNLDDTCTPVPANCP